ncbi:MAG: hypothetical protein BWX54_00391 [Verrucomicrobia bacterium ADurb.Bin018]|nr:MAG: hypothetical protein BWX54_00391 [Verrucomicrobia bacterium ADurb.Bin018]
MLAQQRHLFGGESGAHPSHVVLQAVDAVLGTHEQVAERAGCGIHPGEWQTQNLIAGNVQRKAGFSEPALPENHAGRAEGESTPHDFRRGQMHPGQFIPCAG